MGISSSHLLRPVRPSDFPALTAIYNHYILNTTISFEEQPLADGQMADRWFAVASAALPWVVIESEDQLVGYAYASPWKSRSAYRYSVESSIYLHPGHLARGLGTFLYTALLDELRQRPIHTVIGGVALPNPASARLHEKLGFRIVAKFARVGFKFGRWIDVAYWQLELPGFSLGS